MSRLRQSILEQLRIWGNNSGCHQRPDRSFFFHGKQFPVCARCTGVIIGQLAAVVYAFVRPVSVLHSVFLLSVMGTDWLIQDLNIKESTNVRRLITGFCGGFGLFSIYIATLKKIVKYDYLRCIR